MRFHRRLALFVEQDNPTIRAVITSELSLD